MNIKSKLFAAAVLIAAAGAANATVINFDNIATGTTCQVNAGGSVDGFTLSAYNGTIGAGFNNATACSFVANTANSGSQYMVNYNSVVGVFTKDVGTFNLDSLYVHSDRRSGSTVVRFQGLDGVGGKVLYTEDLTIQSAWQQVVFTGWANVKTFTWDSVTPNVSNIAIDDFAYNGASNVPEPASLALLGLGIAGLAMSRRTKK